MMESKVAINALRYTTLTCVAIAALSGCGQGTSVSQSINKGIDTASSQLKDSVNKLDLDKRLDQVNQKIKQEKNEFAHDATMRHMGQQIKDGLDTLSNQLDRWLHSGGSSGTTKPTTTK